MLEQEKVVKDAIDKGYEFLFKNPSITELIMLQLLRVDEEHEEGNQLLGLSLHKQEKYEDAIKIFEKCIERNPENADNYNNIALSYSCIRDFEKAKTNLEKAVSLNPRPEFYNNLALQCRVLREDKTAEELTLKAIELKPNDPQLWCNLTGIYGERKNIEEAKKCLLKALEIDPNFPPAHVDLAYSYHLEKDWKRGFEEYEYRFEYFRQLVYYKTAYPADKKWVKGNNPTNKRVILYCEQGAGDAIHFVRYAKFVKNLGNTVILHCPESLKGILSRAEGIDEVFCRDIVHHKGDDFPEYDVHCSVMSLPYLLDNYEISGEPYLKPLNTFNMKESYPNTFNIGITWAGSPAHPNDRGRSMALKHFKPIADIPNVKLFNLQIDLRQRKYKYDPDFFDYTDGVEFNVVDMRPYIQHFDDTATLITGMDLVICVDTALVHLAGSLGVPCWMLTPWNPDWRWGMTGETTEWYDSVRLFRQSTPNDWAEVIQDVKSVLSLSVK